MNSLTWPEYEAMAILEGIYPLGVVRDDLRAALMSYVAAASAGAKNVTPASFFLHDLLRHEQRAEDIMQKVRILSAFADKVEGLDLEHFINSQNTE